MTHPTRPPRAALAILMVAASCGTAAGGPGDGGPVPSPAGADAPRIVQPGAPGEPSRAVTPADAVYESAPHTAADVAFMKGMIHHHAQALVMSAMVAERTRRADMRLLAERITISQQDEIAMMRTWLGERGETAPAMDMGDPTMGMMQHDLMPGMLNAEDMARLEAARGTEFDKLFLASMIFHHEGAIVMVEELFSTPGAAQEDQILTFASHVDSDQRSEIARMGRMLNAILASGG